MHRLATICTRIYNACFETFSLPMWLVLGPYCCGLLKVMMSTYQVFLFDISVFLIRSDKGLTLETSAFESLYGDQFTLSTQLMKPNYLVILPTAQHHSFLGYLPLISVFCLLRYLRSCEQKYGLSSGLHLISKRISDIPSF